MGRVLISKAVARTPKASDVLASYHPEADGLTYYYWDDWALSGLLKPAGLTLTLGLAGGAGPRRLAITDTNHRQIGVDLDVSRFTPQGWNLRAENADALRYIAQSGELFDTIWVDLYGPSGLLTEVLSTKFLGDLRRRLAPGGAVFVHLFRPENRFYRYSRRNDPFEPLYAAAAANAGFRAAVFDHYASQTWVLSEEPADQLRDRLSHLAPDVSEDLCHWLEQYMLRILRAPRALISPPTDNGLLEAFRAPLPGEVLAACGLSPVTGASDFDSWTQRPTVPPRLDANACARTQLEWETLAMWTTAPGMQLASELREALTATMRLNRGSLAPEIELRRGASPRIRTVL